jgi:hypothetical protein
MGFKVRPFEKYIERPPGDSAIKVCGSISDGAILFSVAGASWSIPTITCSSDAQGPFAIIEPQEIPVGNGFMIKVQEGFDAPETELAVDSEIALMKPADTSRMTATLRQQGREPEQVNLLVPPDAYVSVSFDWSGRVNGGGCMGLAESLDEMLSRSTDRVLN